MKKEDLIEKLEKTKLPEIELKGHREWLKIKLIDWKYYRKEAVFEFLPILKRVGFFSGSLVLILLVFFFSTNFLYPKDKIATAQKIALNDPQVKLLIEEGKEIKDVEVINGKAYLLISPKIETEKQTKEFLPMTAEVQEPKENLPTLTEVNLKEKRVSKIEEIKPENFPLNENEEEKAKEIAKIERERIIKIESLPSLELMLKKEKNQIKVEPKEKKALIIYREGNEKWLKKINLQTQEIEETEFLGIEE